MSYSAEGAFTVKYKIDYSKYEWLKKITLKNLGISNLYNLRDRFEGQAYLERFLVRSYGELALEKYFDQPIIDLDQKENNKDYSPAFFYGDKKIALFSFTAGQYPKINRDKFDIGVFILVNLDYRTSEILGFLDFSLLLQLVDNKHLSPLQRKLYFGEFKEFVQLVPINEISLR
ncbi:MAG: hypothetical protein LWX70_16165 [Sphingobacteriia bacterium]|nr:hypothetical protein [Sphingobacteriia bacterium]